jgi:hypothetical protein
VGRPGCSRFSPFFHAIVVAGAGVSALDCGGATVDVGETKSGDGGSSAGGKAATGGASQSAGGSGGSRPATGGSAATGGSTATGGTPLTGGSPGVEPLPDRGTLAQWDCTEQELGVCYHGQNEYGLSGRVLSESCRVDPSRPRTAADCPANYWFACQSAWWWPENQTAVYVNCQCISTDGGCTGVAYPGAVACEIAVCLGEDLICGCAHPVILR